MSFHVATLYGADKGLAPGATTCATTKGPISIESGCLAFGAVFIVSISYCDDPSGLSTEIFTPNAFS